MLRTMLSTLALGSLCVSSAFAKDFTFYQYSKPVEVIDGVEYPRTDLTLYRGINSKKNVNAGTASAAMLGESDFIIESPFFRYLRKGLMKKKFYKKQWRPSLSAKDYNLDPASHRRIQQLQVKNNYKPYDWDDALELSKGLVSDYFNSLSDRKIINTYIDYKSPTWNDWPWDAVFSTMDVGSAAKYGEYVMGWKEKEPRSIELGHWNYKVNNQWSMFKRDAGEYSAPGYIPGDWLVSYELREKLGACVPKAGVRPGELIRWNCYYGKLKYGFYKSTLEGRDYVLVFSGYRPDHYAFDDLYASTVGYYYSDIAGATGNAMVANYYAEAICKVGEFDYRVCIPEKYRNKKGSTKKEKRDRKGVMPTLTNSRPRLVGIIARCKDANSCVLPSMVSAKPVLKSKELPRDLKKAFNKVKAVTFKNGDVAVFHKVK